MGLYGFPQYITENIMYNYIRFITTENNTESFGDLFNDKEISISDDPKEPYLQYYDRTNKSWIPIDNIGKNGMSKLDDLYTELSKRDWNITTRFAVLNNTPVLTKQTYDSEIPVISKTDDLINISERYNLDDYKYFEDIYNKMIKKENMEKTIIELQNNYHSKIISSRDLLEKSSISDLLSLTENSKEYTNIININELLYNNNLTKTSEFSYSIKIGISYVKNKKRYSSDFIFKPMDKDESDSLVNINSVFNVNSDITLEINDGCIRLFSESPEITENIIQYCYVIYEKLL